MIIIERSYNTPNPRGGRDLHRICRKVFADNDIEGIQKFLDERKEIKGYEWTNLEFKFIKL